MRKKTGLLLLCLCLVLAAGCGDKDGGSGVNWPGSLKSDELLCVGDAVCPVAEAMIFVTTQKNIYQDSYGGDIWSVNLENGTFESYIMDGLKAYMGRMFATAEMAKASGMELSAADAEKVSRAAAEYMASLDASDVSAMNITENVAASAYEQYVLAKRLYDETMNQEAVEVSDDEARIIRIQRIFISTEGLDASAVDEKRARAEDAWEKINSGEKEFVSVAESCHEGDDWDMEVMRGQLSAREEEVAYGLESGAVSELVEIDAGYVIIKCISSLEESATALHKEQLLETKKDRVFQEHLDAFLKEHPVVFNETAWKKIGIADYSGAASANFYTVYQKYFSE